MQHLLRYNGGENPVTTNYSIRSEQLSVGSLEETCRVTVLEILLRAAWMNSSLKSYGRGSHAGSIANDWDLAGRSGRASFVTMVEASNFK
jgi:hypothetical protein